MSEKSPANGKEPNPDLLELHDAYEESVELGASVAKRRETLPLHPGSHGDGAWSYNLLVRDFSEGLEERSLKKDIGGVATTAVVQRIPYRTSGYKGSDYHAVGYQEVREDGGKITAIASDLGTVLSNGYSKEDRKTSVNDGSERYRQGARVEVQRTSRNGDNRMKVFTGAQASRIGLAVAKRAAEAIKSDNEDKRAAQQDRAA